MTHPSGRDFPPPRDRLLNSQLESQSCSDFPTTVELGLRLALCVSVQTQIRRFAVRRPPRGAALVAQPGTPNTRPRQVLTSLSDWRLEQRYLEDQAHHAQQSEIVGSLASGIAHDLNVVLMAILSNADLLTLRTDADDPRRSYIEEIRDAVTRGSGLARQLSVFKRQLHLKRVDINHLIAQMETPFHRLMGSDISLVSRLSPVPIVISVDPRQMEQLLLHLIINARDEMPGGGQITIETSVAADPIVDGETVHGQYLRLSVTNTGCGSSPAGLGLATVQAIVARHGGVVQVESANGRGTTARVFMPCGERENDEHAA